MGVLVLEPLVTNFLESIFFLSVAHWCVHGWSSKAGPGLCVGCVPMWGEWGVGRPGHLISETSRKEATCSFCSHVPEPPEHWLHGIPARSHFRDFQNWEAGRGLPCLCTPLSKTFCWRARSARAVRYVLVMTWQSLGFRQRSLISAIMMHRLWLWKIHFTLCLRAQLDLCMCILSYKI